MFHTILAQKVVMPAGFKRASIRMSIINKFAISEMVQLWYVVPIYVSDGSRLGGRDDILLFQKVNYPNFSKVG